MAWVCQSTLVLDAAIFCQQPLTCCFVKGGSEMFNRFKLGRTLAEIYTPVVICCLVNLLWLFVPKKVLTCASIISIRRVFPERRYVPDSDEQAITSTHGYSKDHRSTCNKPFWS